MPPILPPMPDPAPRSVLELIRAGTSWLERHGVESARLNAELLLAHHLGCRRMDLYLRFDRQPPPAVLDILRADLRRRAGGIPLQHLLGSVDFLGREFRCDARALIPRPETEVLVERCLELPLPADARVLDVGSGSGVIGLSLAAARPGWRVSLLDASADALALTAANASTLGLSDRVRLLPGDLLDRLDAGERFELIVSNPPYIPRAEIATLAAEVRHDPPLALDGGPDGLDLVRRLVASAPRHLTPGGWLALEVGHDQGQPGRELMRQAGFPTTGLWSDLEAVPRFPWARQPGDPAEGSRLPC